MSRILVVDDEAKIVKLLRMRMEEMGHTVGSATDLDQARALLKKELYDLLITDVRLPDGSGIELLDEAKKNQPALPVIVITAYGTIQDAVRAMQLGASEYIQKPFELEALAVLAQKVLEAAKIRAEHSYLMEQVLEGEQRVELVGRSPLMENVRGFVAKIAATVSHVLITGESGTGKELVAQAIHYASTGRAQPLIRVNCPGIPAQLFESEVFGHMRGSFTGAYDSRKGKFELAGKGTILLDEIAEIPLDLQAKLLRVLEERRFCRVGGSTEVAVEARVIAATNKDLKAMVDQGRFREDLYYRLNVFPIKLPPLRERKGDIPELAMHLLCHVAASCGLLAKGISKSAVSAMMAYSWPGNVRELRNILERALVLSGGDVLDLEHLPIELQEQDQENESDPRSFLSQVDGFKKKVLLDTLSSCGWRKKDAAAALQMSQRAFSYYVNRFQLDKYRS